MVTRRAAVLGSPIAHSRSPALHRAAYTALGLDWTYDAIEVTSAQLPSFIDACAWPEWAGLSLTMPLKTDVLPFLDHVSDTASLVRAANTVVVTEQGRSGHNTDVGGMVQALQEAHGPRLAPQRGAVIGSGATARSALAALSRLGVREAVVIARSPESARQVTALGDGLQMRVSLGSWGSTEPIDADVVIATVPPRAADPLVVRVPERPGVLLDVAYGAGPTALLTTWSRAGGTVADGLDLLLWQAADQVHLMTGRDAPVAAMREALRNDAGHAPA